jgi:trk system potassium uptake protein TrkH
MRFDVAALARPAEYRRGALQAITGVQVFVLSFAGLIAIGTLGFLILPGLYTGARLGVVDALFTSASAVCVTGLIVVDTATFFTHLGQVWILLLIQAGGLGILTFATLIIRVLGRRSALEVESAAGSGVGTTVGSTGRVVRSVVLLTASIEGAGALGLWLLWRGALGNAGAVWPAVFNAVSAFCNAGFSTFSDSLMGWRNSPPVLFTVGMLIVLGGLGFVVLENMWDRFAVRRTRRLTLHSQVAIGATAVVIVSAAVLFFVFEGDVTLRGMGVGSRAANALFMAVTPRTAGFNAVDYERVSNPSLVLTLALMFIGGSPGSTAGGIKVTTVAVLVLGLWARLRGQRHVSIGGRTIREETLGAAAALAVSGLSILVAGVFLLLMVERAAMYVDRTDLIRVTFEVHSAFGTVGLSMNRTASFSQAGRLILTALMFVGRVGPLALAAAMAARRVRRSTYRFAHSQVAIG